VPYIFNISNADANPGNGKLAYNGVSASSTTVIFINKFDASTSINTQTDWYDSWIISSSPNKGYLVVGSRLGDGSATIFKVTGITTGSLYYKIAVTYVSGASFIDTTPLVVSFSATGDFGATGIYGASGASGATGVQGASGPEMSEQLGL
jgi:hypothetical protein